MTKLTLQIVLGIALIVARLTICQSRGWTAQHRHRVPLLQRPLSPSTRHTLRIRAGARSSGVRESNVPVAANPFKISSQTTAVAAGTMVAFYVLWESRTSWLGLFNKEKLLAKTLQILNHLDEQPKLISYTTYVLGMAAWEALGLSTIPVETASGMVFGWTGFMLSALGKFIGAILAFCLARYSSLATFIQKKLSTNEVLQLLEGSAAAHPLQVAILMKLSCFPETIKNYGSALLFPIRLWMFAAATMAHGWTFSALWTYLGVDTAKRLEATGLPTDQRLQFLLTLALINGIVVSPLAMAYWLKSLRRTTKEKENKKVRPI
jgi:uncharacterized membrane protein YdjX (TVP38/TMEM64 family)